MTIRTANERLDIALRDHVAIKAEHQSKTKLIVSFQLADEPAPTKIAVPTASPIAQPLIARLDEQHRNG